MARPGTDATKTVGARLSPAARRAHLLDVARSIVETAGTGALTMESVAEQADVSRGLVYAYFDNRSGLLHALWAEVESTWGGDPLPPLDRTPPESYRELFEARLEANTIWYFDMIERSGLLFHRFKSEPVLEESVEALRKRIHADNVEWWAELIGSMGVDAERALVFSTLFNGASEMLWELIALRRADRAVIEEVFFASAYAALDDLLQVRVD